MKANKLLYPDVDTTLANQKEGELSSTGSAENNLSSQERVPVNIRVMSRLT